MTPIVCGDVPVSSTAFRFLYGFVCEHRDSQWWTADANRRLGWVSVKRGLGAGAGVSFFYYYLFFFPLHAGTTQKPIFVKNKQINKNKNKAINNNIFAITNGPNVNYTLSIMGRTFNRFPAKRWKDGNFNKRTRSWKTAGAFMVISCTFYFTNLLVQAEYTRTLNVFLRFVSWKIKR